MSVRRACRTRGHHRSTQRKVPQGRADEQHLTDDIIELADQYGLYGYRMVTGLLNNAGCHPWQLASPVVPAVRFVLLQAALVHVPCLLTVEKPDDGVIRLSELVSSSAPEKGLPGYKSQLT